MNLNLSILLPFFFFFFIYSANAADPPVYNLCNGNNNTGISRNIHTLLDILVSSTVQNGFTATSYGEGANEIYGLAQCRGDVSKNNCSLCIKDAAKEILNLCPSQTDSRIWYDYCFLRYSTVNFFGRVDTSGAYLINVQNVTEPGVFHEKLGALIDRIRSEAVDPANKRLGKGESEISPFVTLYSLVQCTRDLSEIDCGRCLATAIGNFPRFCGNRRGCQALYSSCTTRYELYPFYF